MFKPRFANKSFGRLVIPAVGATSLVGGYFYYRDPAANPSSGGQAERSRQKRDKEAMSGAGIGQNSTSGGHETGQPGSGIQPGTGDVERDPQTTASKDKLPAGGVGGGEGAGKSNARAIDINAKGGEKRNDITDNMSSLGSGGSKKLTAKLDSGDSSDSSNASTNTSTSSSNPPTRAGASTNNESLGSNSADYKVHSKSYPTSTADHHPNSQTQSTEGLSLSQRLQSTFSQGGQKSGEPGESQRMYSDTRVHSNHADTPTKRHT